MWSKANPKWRSTTNRPRFARRARRFTNQLAACTGPRGIRARCGLASSDLVAVVLHSRDAKEKGGPRISDRLRVVIPRPEYPASSIPFHHPIAPIRGGKQE